MNKLTAPQSCESSPPQVDACLHYAKIKLQLAGVFSDAPTALVIPTARDFLENVRRLAMSRRIDLVGGGGDENIHRPGTILSSLKAGVRKHDLAIMSDQLLHPADASVLVLEEIQNRYFSSFEVVLSLRYGYHLSLWTNQGFIDIPPNQSSPERIFKALSAYLVACKQLGDDWEVANLQINRLPAQRRRATLQRIRYFRSAVLDALCYQPNDLELIRLLEQSDALVKRTSTVNGNALA